MAELQHSSVYRFLERERCLDTVCAFRLDDRGDVHLQAHSRAIHVDDSEDNDLARVKESGHVEWRVRRGHVHVRLRPSLVSPAAYARVMEWLVGHRPERVLAVVLRGPVLGV